MGYWKERLKGRKKSIIVNEVCKFVDKAGKNYTKYFKVQ